MVEVARIVEERKGKSDGVEFVEGLISIVEGSIGQLGNFFTELLRAATVNPFLGLVVACIIADILTKAKLIYPSTRLLILGGAIAAFGLQATDGLLTAIGNLVGEVDPIDALKGIFGSQPSTPPLLQNQNAGQVIVYSGKDLDPAILEYIQKARRVLG